MKTPIKLTRKEFRTVIETIAERVETTPYAVWACNELKEWKNYPEKFRVLEHPTLLALSNSFADLFRPPLHEPVLPGSGYWDTRNFYFTSLSESGINQRILALCFFLAMSNQLFKFLPTRKHSVAGDGTLSSRQEA